MASGPSMCQADADYVRGKARSIVVNSTFRLAPWANVLYTNDHDWLQEHQREVLAKFCGQVYCGHEWCAEHDWIAYTPFDKDAPGLKAKPGHIAWGMNSGAAAISLAYFMGATRILLLGFDQAWKGSKARWHGAHPPGLQNQRPGFHRWAKWFEQAAIDAKALGIEIINVSRETTPDVFPKGGIEGSAMTNSTILGEPGRMAKNCRVLINQLQRSIMTDTKYTRPASNYFAMHQRLQKLDKGRCQATATGLPDCQKPAREWALRHEAKAIMDPKHNLTYSTLLSDYLPLCTACHRRYDGNSKTMWERDHAGRAAKQARGETHRKAHGHTYKLTEQDVLAIHERRESGESGRAIADSFSVSEATISMVVSR